MKKFAFRTILVALVIGLVACDESDPGVETPEEEPQPTMVGVPNGAPVSKTIGADGGSLSIAGEVELIIPAGALSSNTEISIQPLTNNAPNGNGNAYRFGPEGTKFSKPVKVTFPYSLPNPSTPPLTGIAFQDTDGIWYSTGKFTWDTTNKTVSTETTHFSDWATFDVLRLRCEDIELNLNEVTECVVFAMRNYPENPLGPVEDEEAMLTPLRNSVPVGTIDAFDLIIEDWLANGVEADALGPYGKIAPKNGGCTYTAPTAKPNASKNPVNLSANLKDILYRDPVTGTVFEDLQLFTSIEIIGVEDYTLILALDYSGLNATSFQCGLGEYIDSTVFVISVLLDDIVVLQSIDNSDPAFTYNTLGCTCLDMKFTNGSVIDYTDFSGTYSHGVLVYELTSTWCGSTDRFQCEDNDAVTLPGIVIPGNVESGNIDLPTGQIESIVYPWGNGTLTVIRKN